MKDIGMDSDYLDDIEDHDMEDLQKQLTGQSKLLCANSLEDGQLDEENEEDLLN